MYLEEISSGKEKFAAIYTYTDATNQTKAYLQPLYTSSKDENVIVAKVEEKPSYFFEIKPTKVEIWASQS